jgi:chorismate mutase
MQEEQTKADPPSAPLRALRGFTTRKAKARKGALNKSKSTFRRLCEENRMKLKEEHAVAIAEKAVLMLDCVGVSG